MPGPADIFAPLPIIETHLQGLFSSPGTPAALRDAVHYALVGGGKRLRPLLAWHACVAAGAPGELSLTAGAAVEMIHAFSLVHDDLPAIDNDDMRRGKPTLHRHAGEAMAILAGDAMIAAAFDLLTHAPVDATPPLPTMGDHAVDFLSGGHSLGERIASERAIEPMLRLALVKELVVATLAMIDGQVWDTLGGPPGDSAPIEQLRLIHRNKTGALIRAACRVGAISALRSADETNERLVAISAFGEAVGLMFQVVDDLLDVTQTSEHTGKRTGKDAQAGKLTYPGVLGPEGTAREVSRLRDEALRAIEPLGPGAGGLRDLCNHLCVRTK